MNFRIAETANKERENKSVKPKRSLFSFGEVFTYADH